MLLRSNPSQETSLHPICLLSSTDTQTFSLYHSFFLVSLETFQSSQEILIKFRVPSQRNRIEDIESAVKYFVTSIATSLEDDYFGTFVITTSDGSRFHAAWRGSESHLFVAVSVFPLISFTRKIFTLIGREHSETISPILCTLCEYPIVAAASLIYNIRLFSGSLTLKFDQQGLVEDEDMNLVASRLLSPQMLVESWEALLLENKVLVISTIPSIVPYCCEFLRRLVLPLVVINTYVPFLHEELLGTIEAPFPYLVGAQTDQVYAHRVDLSDTFVVDLDRQCVVSPPRASHSSGKLPQSIRSKILREINDIRLSPLEKFVQRSTTDLNNRSEDKSGLFCNFFGPSFLGEQEPHSILQSFIRLNLSLFGARYCDVRAFYRRCERPFSPEGSIARKGISLPKYKGPDGKAASMGFSLRNGVICGCMQLLNERKDINLLQFLPCWVELDEITLSVYEFADEMPLIFILNRDITAVSPSPVEPEGHVFDIQLTSQMTYRFAATDPESRREWIQEIDKISDKRTQFPSQLSIQISGVESEPFLGSLEENSGHETCSEEFSSLSRFRAKVAQTQMVSFFKSRSEFHEYESILNEQSLTADALTSIPHKSALEPKFSLASQPLAKEDLSSKKTNSKKSSDILCGAEIILNLKLLWSLFITGEDSPQSIDSKNLLPPDREGITTSNTDGVIWLDISPTCRDASLVFLSKMPRDYSYLDAIHQKFIQSDNEDKLLTAKREANWSKNFFRSLTGSDMESSLTSNSLALKDELNQAIRDELKLRHYAGELLQRISTTHRQCETDLRKLIVQLKMVGLANIQDINYDHHNSAVFIDIEKISSIVQTDMEHQQRNLLRAQSPKLSWEETLRSWGDRLNHPIPLSRQNSNDTKRKSFEQDNILFTHSQISTDVLEDMKLFFCGINLETYDESHGRSNADFSPNISRNPKIVFKSPEINSIRNVIKDCIADQLACSSDPNAPNFSKVLIPILQGMNGYVCGRIPDKDREAIQAYGEGAFGDQVRIMRCLVQIFLSYSQSSKEKVLSEACNSFESRDLNKSSSTTPESMESQLFPESASHLHLVTATQVEDFLIWASSVGDIIGLQAIRFITELIHRCLCRRMNERIVEQCEILPLQTSTGENLSSEFKREVAHGIFSRQRLSLSNMQPSFIWVNAALTRKTEVLNELVVCKMSASKPCELSIQLLNSLREMLRSICQEACNGSSGEAYHQFQPTEKEREKLITCSAYRAFELQCCQLQISDISTLEENSKIVFFGNIFNIMTVHSILSRGYSGNGLYDKCNFMRTTKYNINGIIFNLLEIEHNILRAQTASPSSMLGPLMSISEKSPKTAFAIHRPIPLISFTIFLACGSSPALTTLWDPNSVDLELKRAASNYILAHSRVERLTRTLFLPELLKWYSKDFGGSNKGILQTVLSLIGKDNLLYEDIARYIDLNKPNLAYISFDWRFQLVI